MSYKQSDAYRWYVGHAERPDSVPAFKMDGTEVKVPAGEVFCRFKRGEQDGKDVLCPVKTKNENPSNLRRHITSHKVGGVKVTLPAARKGGLSIDENADMVDFWRNIRAYCDDVAAGIEAPAPIATPTRTTPAPKAKQLLEVPFTLARKDNPPHPNMIQMKKMAGMKSPCEACMPNKSCPRTRNNSCLLWNMFKVDRREVGQSVVSGAGQSIKAGRNAKSAIQVDEDTEVDEDADETDEDGASSAEEDEADESAESAEPAVEADGE